MNRLRSLTVWILLTTAGSALADSYGASVGAVAPLAVAGASARSAAMGSAFVAVADDASALFSNPAGVGLLTAYQVSVHHHAWIAGINEESALFGMPVGNWGGAVFSVSNTHFGSFEGRTAAGDLNGEYSPERSALGAAWGRRWFKNLSLGLGLHSFYETLGEASITGYSADLGGLWDFSQSLRLGASLLGLGPAIGDRPLASSIQVGGSFKLDAGSANRLWLAASAALEPQGIHRVYLGAEDMILSTLALRAGYLYSLADNQLSGLTGLTLGTGVAAGPFSLDYAYAPFGELGDSQRLSLTLSYN